MCLYTYIHKGLHPIISHSWLNITVRIVIWRFPKWVYSQIIHFLIGVSTINHPGFTAQKGAFARLEDGEVVLR